jgi:hypothetical protein
MPIQKINVDLAMISNGRYESAASIDANARFPPAVLALFDMMAGVREREEEEEEEEERAEEKGERGSILLWQL